MPLAGNFDYDGLMGATRHFLYSPGSKRLTRWSTELAWLIKLYQSPEVLLCNPSSYAWPTRTSVNLKSNQFVEMSGISFNICQMSNSPKMYKQSGHLLTGSKTWLLWSGSVLLHRRVANDEMNNGANHLAQRRLNSIHSFVILAQLFFIHIDQV